MRRTSFLITVAVCLILAGLLLFFFSPFTASKGELRAAIDIGSGSTNLKVARIDPQTSKILRLVFEKSIPVPYQKHLEQSPNQTFDTEVRQQGIRAVKALKEMADSYQVQKVVAVATAAFRQAKNGAEVAQEIEQETGVAVHIISQEEEGILAFRGALAVTTLSPEHTVSWDIGGGSMQFTTVDEEGHYLVDKGKTASIPFKNAVIREIKHQDPRIIHSPNPLTLEELQAAVNYASNLAKQTSPEIQEKIREPGTEVLAVSSIFNYRIYPLLKRRVVHLHVLERAVLRLANKRDHQLPGGALAEVAVTNPALVLGYQKALHMPHFTIIDINNADGALTYPPYWKE